MFCSCIAYPGSQDSWKVQVQVTQDGVPIHHRAHTYTPNTIWQLQFTLACCWTVRGNQITLKGPHGDMGEQANSTHVARAETQTPVPEDIRQRR